MPRRPIYKSRKSPARGMPPWPRSLATNLELDRTFAYTRDLERRIAALTPDEVRTAFRKHIDPRKIVIVRAGDFK